MKKIILLCFVVMSFATASFAQFNLGIKGGLNYSKIKADEKEIDKSGILGYNIGVWARIGKIIYLQPEVYLGSKGSDLKFNILNNSEEQTGKLKFTTIDVPVLLGTKIGMEKLNLRIMAGPSFQYNIDTDDSAFKQATNIDFYKYNDFVTNLQAGAGLDFGSMSLDLRYETSLKDINKEKGQKQNLLHVSLGIRIF